MSTTRVATGGLPDYFLSWKDVIAMTRNSEMTIRRAIDRHDFPALVKLFGKQSRSVGFRKADYYLWCEGRWNLEGGV